ncbi:MAG: hypothetical protein H0W34_14155 [Pyrinomonadaceae bacterium]|nr:hypothetical protein [Pyrinomonadaceae bacterium]MBA3568736.1 hypothetical protein [Pyrinomonadaceae bacterium]MBA3573081.1 hypothetical protein [Pyrinomonadaceae bacterium]MDQ3173430.1 hypothetical protein [Acidobacteriota bacterium]
MSINNNTDKPFTFRFVDSGSAVVLELTNRGDQTLKSVEILSIFLKDIETLGGGPSQAHIRFETIESIQPRGMAVLSPRTWIAGKPVDADRDQLARLEEIEGQVKPYVLDISWQDADEKMRFQRIPLGH